MGVVFLRKNAAKLQTNVVRTVLKLLEIVQRAALYDSVRLINKIHGQERENCSVSRCRFLGKIVMALSTSKALVNDECQIIVYLT